MTSEEDAEAPQKRDDRSGGSEAEGVTDVAEKEGGEAKGSDMRDERTEGEADGNDERDNGGRPEAGWRDYRAAVIIGAIFCGTIVLGLILSPIYSSQGMKAFPDEEDVRIPLLYIVFIVGFTGAVLFIVKKGKKNLVRWGFLGAIFFTMLYVVSPVLAGMVHGVGEDWTEEMAGEDVKAWETIRLIDRSVDLYLDGNGNFFARSEGMANFSSSVGSPPEGNFRIEVGAVWEEENNAVAAVFVKGSITHLFTVSETEGGITVRQHNVTFPDLPFTVGGRPDNMTKKRLLVTYLAPSGENYSMNRSVLELEMGDSAGSPGVSAEVSYSMSENFSALSERIPDNDGSLGGAVEVEAITHLGKDGGKAFIAVSTSNATYIYEHSSENNTENRTGLKYVCAVEFPDLKGAESVMGGNGEERLVLYSRDEFRVFGDENDPCARIAKGKTGREIAEVISGELTGDDEEELFVLSAGKIYVFGGDGWGTELGHTEEEITGGKKLSISDGDGDGDPEFRIIAEDALYIYELEGPPFHLWSWLVGALVSGTFILALLFYPEWYFVDLIGIMVAAGAMGLIGISLSLFPVLILLVLLAVYDAVAVYKTKHMISLADSVMSMRLPVLLVVPKKAEYSFRQQKGLKEELEKKEGRDAMFMGLGDIIIPGILVVSAFTYLPETSVLGIDGNLLVALSALFGGLLGYSVLMRFVLKGNPQAGLPLLNGGTILGYVVSSLLVYGNLGFTVKIPYL